jgi:hypothetical protein
MERILSLLFLDNIYTERKQLLYKYNDFHSSFE